MHHGHHHHHHHDHGHGHSNEKAVGAAAALAELVGGVLSGSLALLADAGHMLTDFAALMLAWFAFRLARRPADWKRTYGFDRFSVLAAFVNGVALFAIAAWIVVEAVRRLLNPGEVLGGVMLVIAVAGLAVNIAAFWILMRGDNENLNVRAAAIHVMGDLLGSVAAILAALVILFTGWTPIDPLLSVLVALLILRSACKVVRESGHILLEGSPHDLDPRQIAEDLTRSLDGLEQVEHVHIWSITQERRMATLEAFLTPGASAEAVKDAIKSRMNERYRIGHVTVEVAPAEKADG